MFTYTLYPFLLAVNFAFFLTLVLPKINLKTKNWPYLITITLLSLSMLLISTPRHIVFGEFEYMGVAESIASGRGFKICFRFDGQECSQLSTMDRPPGPPFLWAIPLVFGVNPLDSALFVSVTMMVLSGALVYLAAKELSGSKNALIIALVFITLISRTKLQWTAVSEISYLFFFIMAAYFLIRYIRSSEDLGALLATFSYLFHTRPEAFMVTFPLVALVSYTFHKKKEFKDKLKLTLFILFIFNYLFASFHILSRSSRPTWEIDPITRLDLFSKNVVGNTQFFFNLDFFNPLISLLFVYSIYKAVKERNKLLLALTISFLIGFTIYTSFEFGRVSGIMGHNVRYTLVPSLILLLVSSNFIPNMKIFSNILVLISAYSLLVSPVLTVEEGTATLIEILKNDTLGVGNYSTIFFSPPNIMHFIYPDKEVYSAEYMNSFSGSAVYIHNPFGPLELDIQFPTENCNSTLIKEVSFLDFSTTSYELVC